MIEQSGPIVMSKRSLLYINRLEKFIRRNGQMSQLPSVLDTSDCLHYHAIVAIMKTSSLRRRMTTDDGRLVPGQTVMMMRGLGSGQKRTSMALGDWGKLPLPHMCLCPGTTMHCPRVPSVVGWGGGGGGGGEGICRLTYLLLLFSLML